jgi:hypothetical protein
MGAVIAAQTQNFCSGSANSRTFQVELDTAGHHFNILFLQAGCSTVVTSYCTGYTGIDTFLELLM